jgi:citrate lyase subunit beta / citryl-CoA lyase
MPATLPDAGFRAKACIHPSHVAIIRAAFAVTPEQMAWALGVLEAERQAVNGVFTFEGRMIDGPLISQARQIAQQPAR